METQLRHRTAVRPNALRDAFTLIEMMVVVALIGILIGGVFRLLSAAGESAKRAETIERIQRLENAISGFYAKYGTYPPVAPHGSPDPKDKEDDEGKTTSAGKLEAGNANRAARCQPVAFEFPTMVALDPFITATHDPGIVSANVNENAFDSNVVKWPEVRLFKLGVTSFIVPRWDALGEYDDQGELRNGNTKFEPKPTLLKVAQWTSTNKKYEAKSEQLKAERAACAEWLPNLKGLIYGGKTIMGVDTAEKEAGFPRLSQAYSQGTGNRHVLGIMTVRDSWGRDLYYYSAPPYQSYRLWSAGPAGNTFPCGLPAAPALHGRPQNGRRLDQG
jgi:prepilin-type N-terminal cleavage/methylation domain-containing protein